MNKSVIFALGTLIGAAGGSVATYYLTKEMFAQQAAEEIENYAQHCEERIARIRGDEDECDRHQCDPEEEDDTPEPPKTNDPNEDAINRNEGVKKYHHNNGLESTYGANQIFTSPQKEKEKSEVQKEIHEIAPRDSKLINDIDEEEWMRENGYDKQTLDIFLGDDKDIFGVWGYGTDNEEDADRKWGKPTADLIGRSHTFDELLSYCKDSEDGIGLAYVKNDELMIDFELVIHDSREDDKD